VYLAFVASHFVKNVKNRGIIIIIRASPRLSLSLTMLISCCVNASYCEANIVCISSTFTSTGSNLSSAIVSHCSVCPHCTTSTTSSCQRRKSPKKTQLASLTLMHSASAPSTSDNTRLSVSSSAIHTKYGHCHTAFSRRQYSIRQQTSAYVSIRQHTSAYVSRQVSRRQHERPILLNVCLHITSAALYWFLFLPGCSCLISLSTNLNAPAIANKVLCRH
jgi:hypothetical protein